MNARAQVTRWLGPIRTATEGPVYASLTQSRVRMFAAIGLGWGEVIVVLVVLLVLFGAKRLPELARSLGSSVKELQKGMEEGLVDDESDDTEEASGKKS